MEFPPYVATIWCTPCDSEDVENVATPETIGALPSVVGPSVNVTVPVGEANAPFAGAVAVKVTVEPVVAGLGEAVTVSVVAVWATVRRNEALVKTPQLSVDRIVTT